ncbi:MAG: hypothetical protein QOF89_4566 [Acidobacteriota bacterium]|jgi:hypothetical protein|nr:hypothetical protein [Acidobacteriota bacterium]
MADGTGTTSPPVKSYPPPSPIVAPPPPKVLGLVTAAAAATAGFLGYSEVAGILALLSLVFGFWDLFQTRYVAAPPPDKAGDPGVLEPASPVDPLGPKTHDPRTPDPRTPRQESPPSYR